MKVIDLTETLKSDEKNKPCVLVKGLLTKQECDDVLKSIEKEHIRPRIVRESSDRDRLS